MQAQANYNQVLTIISPRKKTFPWLKCLKPINVGVVIPFARRHLQRSPALDVEWRLTVAMNANTAMHFGIKWIVKQPRWRGSVLDAARKNQAWSLVVAVDEFGTAIKTVRRSLGQLIKLTASWYAPKQKSCPVGLSVSTILWFQAWEPFITGETCQLSIWSTCPWMRVSTTLSPCRFLSAASVTRGMFCCPCLSFQTITKKNWRLF